MHRKEIIGIIGGHSQNTNASSMELAEAVGYALGKAGKAIVCGGYDGIMEAACKGCKRGGGVTIGILKGNECSRINPYIDYPILTSMDVACNNIIVWTAQAIVAFNGRFGTLNEMALALDFGKPLLCVGQHPLLNVHEISSSRFLHFDQCSVDDVDRIIHSLNQLMNQP
jgi:uncharacterized protein (TIGR00725 family)